MQFTHIVFDLDGTLSDPADGIRNSLSYALEKLNVGTEVDEVFSRFIGPPLQYGFSEIIGLDDPQTELAVILFREYYASKGIYESSLYPGIVELLSGLGENGVPLYLATSKYEKYASELMEHLGIDSFFAKVSGADYEGKEATKKFLIGNCLNGLSENERAGAVMIGDTKFDIEGARSNHIQSIGVLYGYGTRQELQDAGAGGIAESVKELTCMLL